MAILAKHSSCTDEELHFSINHDIKYRMGRDGGRGGRGIISRIDALNYRRLRYVDQNLGPLQFLVGANATGKKTFLNGVGWAMWRAVPCRELIFSRTQYTKFGLVNQQERIHNL